MASTSQKKQQSISSFFTPKPPHRSSPSLSSQSPHSSNPINGPANGNSNGAGSEDEDTSPVRSARLGYAKRPRDSGVGVGDGVKSPAPALKKRRTLPDAEDELADEETDGSYATRSLSRKQYTSPPTKQKASQVTDRTSKYLFSASLSTKEPPAEYDQETVSKKQRLHDEFIKKLGRPESLASLRGKDRFSENVVPEGEDQMGDEEGDEEEDAQLRFPAKGGKATSSKRGSKLTPMEKQVLDIKKKHPDALLVVEVGYKFRFFGEDARIAAKELSIVCIPGKYRFDEHPSEAHLDRFASASIPTHRLHVHVKRLVSAGHKVGVVRQLETAALKAAGDNRNAPFVRQLTNVYTKGTYVDDIEGLEASTTGPSEGAPATGHLLCITETKAKGWGTDEKVHVGIVAVQPATGDIIYDDFEDGFMRSEIETRLLHIAPCEFLIVGDLSRATDKLVQHLSGSKTNVFGEKARVERVEKPKTAAATSYNHISSFYAERLKSNESAENSQAGKILDQSHKLSEHVSICLSAMIKHLTEYGLQHVFDLTKNFQPFSARSHMLLNGNTLNSLEIYRNQTDNTEKGSLFWVLDQTQTRFGQRMLRKWIGRPLLDRERLEERIGAVEELKLGERTTAVDKLKHLLSKTKSDLEKSLIRIYYRKCTRPELLSVLQTLQRIATEYAHVKGPADAGFSSGILRDAVASLPRILNDVLSYLDRINPQAAKEDDKYAFFREDHETDMISEHKLGIAGVEHELDAHRSVAAEKLKRKKVDYVTVAGIEYLIEVENSQVKNVPASWAKISGTKKVSRFHTPEAVRLIRERDQHREALAAACDRAFADLLGDISAKYQSLRDCVQSLATLDCLASLAEVAGRPGYCKPALCDDACVSVTGGRHPMVEQLLLDAYVPNDICLSAAGARALLITGPNMGGKSSYVRQVALICIMGQVGSYVPAAAARLGMLDAVFTRMGACDNMLAGESTFMVELGETADVLKQATPRSLVVLDELGRGTSTHDGVAIAHAVFDHLVRESRCLLLFITHYQSLSGVARGSEGGAVRNVHMRFTESGGPETQVTFLYELGEGVAHRSYGLNVARLANVPRDVIEVAGVKSKEMEAEMRRAQVGSLGKALGRLAAGVAEGGGELEGLVSGIEQL